MNTLRSDGPTNTTYHTIGMDFTLHYDGLDDMWYLLVGSYPTGPDQWWGFVADEGTKEDIITRNNLTLIDHKA